MELNAIYPLVVFADDTAL